MSKIHHKYHDYGQVKEAECAKTIIRKTHKTGRSQEQTFPVLLHYILGELEKEGKSDIMGWMPHGRAFMVRDHKRMEKEILPFWFRQKKFHSFQRQLNIYGFLRITSGPDKGSYYHELFLRGKRFLCNSFVRTKIKGEGPRKPSSPDTEPNLYLYPRMGPSSSEDEGTLETKSTLQLSNHANPSTMLSTESSATSVPTSVDAPLNRNATTPLVFSTGSVDRFASRYQHFSPALQVPLDLHIKASNNGTHPLSDASGLYPLWPPVPASSVLPYLDAMEREQYFLSLSMQQARVSRTFDPTSALTQPQLLSWVSTGTRGGLAMDQPFLS